MTDDRGPAYDRLFPGSDRALAKLAISLCRRRANVEHGDPTVRHDAILEAWDEGMDDESALARSYPIKLMAGAIGLARQLDFDVNRLRSTAWAESWYRPEYSDIMSPAGQRVAIEAAGHVLIINHPLAILTSAFIRVVLQYRVPSQRVAARVAWLALIGSERERLQAYIDTPEEAAPSIARAAGLSRDLLVVTPEIIKSIVTDGEATQYPPTYSLPALRRLRLLEFRQARREFRRQLSDADLSTDPPTPEDYLREVRGELQAAYEDRRVLADNLSGRSPAEL